jgi:glycosyltransferase involved in cell wall biosynthesis
MQPHFKRKLQKVLFGRNLVGNYENELKQLSMANYQKITFVIPCRNNISYLKQAVGSIESYYGDYHNIIILDDASTDGTWEWIESLNKSHISSYRNDTNDRVGHTVLYDVGIQMATTEIVSILHSDMVISPNYVENILKHMQRGVVVSATRIEPPLHPPGPEKIVRNFGLDTVEFQNSRDTFVSFVVSKQNEYRDMASNGIFAPWAIYKSDFVDIGGHDKLFAPMELEDSDIFNRFYIKGYKLIQSRDSFVYHMTCRGSRFKDGIEIEREIPLTDGTIWYKPKDSQEYRELREIKFREWWRKWHTDVLHDANMLPIVPKRYSTAFVISNCNEYLLSIFEPWCDDIYVSCDPSNYIYLENQKSMYDISKKIHNIYDAPTNSIEIKFDALMVTEAKFSEFIKNIPFIIEETNQIGTFSYDIFQINVKSLHTMDMILPFFRNVI